MKTTQNERVLSYLREFGSINPMQALTDLGVYRLASRISDLKKQGVLIERTLESATNRYGEATHYAVYTLKTEAQQ